MTERLNLYIPFERYDYVGGPATFLRNLGRYMEKRGIRCRNSVEGADHVFFPIAHDLSELCRVQDGGGRIIQRLDGVWYPGKHSEERYTRRNRQVGEIYRHMADFVVFQSEHSRDQCFAMLGERPEESYAIILNGVDREVFYPDEGAIWDGERPLRLVSTGNFRDPAMIEPVVEALDSLEGEFEFELHLAGPIRDESLQKYFDRDFVTHHGSLALPEVASLLRESDLFVYSHLNPPCPNSVLEAVSCGLPVVGFDSGSMAELLPFGTDLLAPVSDEVFQRYEDFHPERLAQKIRVAIEDFDRVARRAREHTDLYPFEECGEKYLEVFRRVIARPREGEEDRGRLDRFLDSKTWHAISSLSNVTPIGATARAITERERSRQDPDKLLDYLKRVIKKRTDSLPPSEALKFLFGLEGAIYEMEGRQSIRYDRGTHTKHRHINYHEFFVRNVEPGENVLDVGSRFGELSADLAAAVDPGRVVGVEIEERCVRAAREQHAVDNLRFVCADATAYRPEEEIDVVVLSNVLEHIEEREAFLRRLLDQCAPEKMLLRVPLFERDWRVPLKKELGVEYRLDWTHCIEYRREEFFAEMRSAGLVVEDYEIAWGEIWAVARPAGKV